MATVDTSVFQRKLKSYKYTSFGCTLTASQPVEVSMRLNSLHQPYNQYPTF